MTNENENESASARFESIGPDAAAEPEAGGEEAAFDEPADTGPVSTLPESAAPESPVSDSGAGAEASLEGTTAALAELLRELAQIGEDAGMRSIAHEIRTERLPALLDGRVSRVVLGEFNHGKSTAINALLGGEVLPTGITPTTSVITHIVSGEGPARIVRDAGAVEVAESELRELLTTEPPNDLRYIEVKSKSDFLSDGVFVVDTPGVNDISKQKVEITYGYVPRADVIVYVLDATQALKRSELAFIEHRLLRGSKERLHFLLGKVDALSEDEVAEVSAHVREQLARLVGDVPLFPVSQRRALRGEDPGFEAFRKEMHAAMLADKAQIVFEGAMRTGRRLAWLMDQNLAIEEGAIRLESDELERRVKNVRVKLDASRTLISDNIALIDQRTSEIAATARDNVRSFAAAFAAALPREVERANAEDLKRYLPDYVHDTFKDWVEEEGTRLAAKLEALAEEIIAITNRNVRDALAEVYAELGVKTRDIDLEVNTFGYDVGVAALGVLGVGAMLARVFLGGVLLAAAPVLAFAVKGKVEGLIRQKASEQGLKAIQAASEKVEAEFLDAVDDFSVKLKRFVEDSGDRLYSQIADALDRVLAERATHADDNDTIVSNIAETRTRITSVRARLEAFSAESAAE